MPIYLDCNATAPLEPTVQSRIVQLLSGPPGNAASRTHSFGQQAKRLVEEARRQIAAVAYAQPDEMVFTSGATESNNIAILGLVEEGERTGRRHVISTAIEHKAVLEPLEELARRGFTVTLIRPDRGGRVDADAVAAALRPDTLLVSIMHVNNETGVQQPLTEVARHLQGHEAYFHVDAAQGFGKDLEPLRLPRIDLISITAHKIYGPCGIGALVTRRRGLRRPPLQALVLGGGHEGGLRPGTLPVALIAGFGIAAELAARDWRTRRSLCLAQRQEALAALQPLGVQIHGAPEHVLPHVLNLSVPGLDSEAAMLVLKDLVAISNGSACTSQSYSPSHVLTAMGLSSEEIQGALRFSWSHMTPPVPWTEIADCLRRVL